jgi:hypothetical protein
MRPSEAAAVIGCTVHQVRALIRNGTLRAKLVPTQDNQHGYTYNVNANDVQHYAATPAQCGAPRGSHRSNPNSV